MEPGWRETMQPDAKTAAKAGREYIAKMAEADGQIIFARQVRAGCWDSRDDVAAAILAARKGRHES